MKSITICFALMLLCSGCSTQRRHFGDPIATDESVLRHEEIEIRANKRSDKVYLASLLQALVEVRKSGHDFAWISRIDFSSESEAVVYFSWSGGFHGGNFSFVRENGKWTLKDEAYIL